MRRIQYILFFLLFVLTGTLCRQQQVLSQLRVRFDHGAMLLTQQTSPADDSKCLFQQSIFAPEITSGIQSRMQDHKAPTKCLVITDLCAGGKPQASRFTLKKSAVLHPIPPDYYIYTLGKIVI